MTASGGVGSRLIVPLDVDSLAKAEAVVGELRGLVDTYKIGLELLWSEGFGVVDRISSMGVKVFLDPKLHDIPNTVRGAATAIGRLPVTMFTVHASGGSEMLRAAVKGALEGAKARSKPPPKVLGVTVLTSIDQQTLSTELGVSGTPLTQVVSLAGICRRTGVDGVVASPNEVRAVREAIGPEMLIVAPGIRPSWAAAQDQKRIATPAEAIRAGATHLVVGRPITSPPDSVGGAKEAAKLVLDEIRGALEQG